MKFFGMIALIAFFIYLPKSLGMFTISVLMVLAAIAYGVACAIRLEGQNPCTFN